jgi:hypothetical protein
MLSLFRRQFPQLLSGPGRRLPHHSLVDPLIPQFLFQKSRQHIQRLCRRSSHAAGIRIRSRKQGLLSNLRCALTGRPRSLLLQDRPRRHFAPLSACGIWFQSRRNPLPDMIVLPEIIDFRTLLSLFHSGPPFFPFYAAAHFYVSAAKTPAFFRKMGKIPLPFRCIFLTYLVE